MKKNKILLLIFSSAFLIVQTSFCQKVINWQAIDASGAGQSSQASRVMYSSFGQPSVGVSTAGTKVLNSGYLYIRIVPQGAPFLLTQSSVSFGNVIVGQSTTQTITIQNTGGAPLNITTTTILSPEFSVVSGGGAQTIPAGGSANMVLRFQPSSAGIRSASLSIASNASNGSPIDIALSGTGITTAPVVTVSTTSLDFGSILLGSNIKKSVTVGNTGNASLTITNQSISGANASDFTITHPSSGTINQSGSDYIEITFAPAATGMKSGTLSFNTNDGNNPTINVNLNGEGSQISQPKLTFSTTLLDFGTTTIGTPLTQDLVISNNGGAVLNINSQMVNGSAYSLITPASSTINPGNNSTVRIQFNPPSIGTWQGTFDVTSNDPSSPSATVNLRGTGGTITGPRISLSRSSIDFGNVQVLTPKDENITIRNIGTADLVISSQTISGTDALHFSIAQPAMTPIATGGSSIATIRHLPLNGGNKIAFYRLQTNDPGSPTVDVALVSVAVGIERLPDMPTGIRLHQNYPNPFNPSTNIVYELNTNADVKIDVYNAYGQVIQTLVDQHQEFGTYTVSFDALNLPGGMYVAVLKTTTKTGIHSSRIMMMLVK